MGLSRLLLAAGLALGPAPPGAPARQGESPPAAADFREQVRRLEPTTPPADRSAALKGLSRHAGAKDAHLAAPALARCVREDPDAGVRAAAAGCLAAVAEKRKEPCPLVLVEAMLDADEGVRRAAGAHAARFREYAPRAVGVLLRAAEADDANTRADALWHLARAGAVDRRAVAAIERGTRDPQFGVRHNAHVARFHATDDLPAFLAYLVRLQEDPDGVLGKVAADSEAGKRDRATRDLASLGAAGLVAEWADKRPDDLAPALVKLLADPSPAARRGAARLIGAAAVKVELPRGDWTKPPAGPPAAQDPPRASNVAVRFEKLKAGDRLRELRDGDPDHTVRAAARLALERLAAVRGKGPAR